MGGATVQGMDSNERGPGDGDAGMYHAQLARVNNELAVLARENRRRAGEYQQLAERLQAVIVERDAAYWQLRKVREVLPMCLGCNRVEDGADWTTLVEFLRERAPFISHGYCPECTEREVEAIHSRDADPRDADQPSA